MLKRWLLFSLLVVFVASLSGCATARKRENLDVQGLRNQVSVLESQIQSKDEEINGLRDALARAQSEKEPQGVTMMKRAGKAKMKVVGSIKSRPNARHIQIALKNAGYDPGPIDGKTGKQTIDAIKAFQRSNNLTVDGHARGKTWELLREYLYKKVK